MQQHGAVDEQQDVPHDVRERRTGERDHREDDHQAHGVGGRAGPLCLLSFLCDREVLVQTHRGTVRYRGVGPNGRRRGREGGGAPGRTAIQR